MKIGVQMYTLHEYCKTLEGFSETLKRVADMGFTTVQVSGTCEYDPEWLRDELKKNGLTCPLTHTPFARMQEMPETVAAEHSIFDCHYIGLGGLPGLWDPDAEKRREAVLRFPTIAKPVAQAFAKAGKYFMYHNHDKEYQIKIDGKTAMEFLSDSFAPDEMGFTLDTYWVKAGGGDPISEINRLSGRLPCVHFKDYKEEADGSHHYTWCGDGNLDFEQIGDALVKAGTDYVFIEQDATFPDEPNPFVCLANSRGYLKALGFEF